MDALHSMLRSIRPDTKTAPNHLSVFREFIAHLGRIQNKAEQTGSKRKPAIRRKGAPRG
ncbi:MAG TPA: hypothetical protein VNZ94_19590 [Xanthobacteraceae bacterium]|nr:hypothetical protein [Xanthobacteraceae bacterium]